MPDQQTDGAPPAVGSGVNPTWTAPVAIAPEPIVVAAPPLQTSPQLPTHVEQVIPTPTSQPVPVVPVSEPQASSPVAIPQDTQIPVLTPSKQPVVPPLVTPPPTVPPVTEPIPSNNIPPSSAPSSLPWKIVIPIVILVLAGGVGGYLWWQGILFGTPRDPNIALLKMANALDHAQSYHIEGTASYQFRNSIDPFGQTISNPDEITVGIGFEHNQEKPGITQTVTTVDLSEISRNLPTGIPSSLVAEVRHFDDQVYLNMPFVATLAGLPTTTWLGMPTSELNLGEKVASNESFDFRTIIQSGERVGYEQIGPVQTGHYRFELATDQIASELKVSPEATADLPTATLDLWLGVRDSLPYQFTLTIAVADGTLPTGDLVITASAGQFGAELPIELPESADVNPGSLASLFPQSIRGFETKTRDAQRKSDLKKLQTALELYKADHATYPIATQQTKTNDPANLLRPLVDSRFLVKLPVDPLDPQYFYGYTSDGTTYELSSILEDLDDPIGVKRGSYTVQIITSNIQTATTQ